MAPSISRSIILFVILVLSFCIEITSAHASCCKHKLHQDHQSLEPELIEDPDDVPPLVWEGQPRHIDDPNDAKPDDWDDDDDGEWAPVRILNPEYMWTPRKIPNPNYDPPPTYWDKLRVEVFAALPWVTLGVLITGMLSLVSLPLETMQWWLQPSTSESSSNALVSLAHRLVQFLSAALLGLATPLCSCGALPLCAALLKQGVPFSSALVFLTASQSAGLDSAAITYGLLGAPAMLGRLGGAIALAMAVGLMCSSLDRIKTTTTKGQSTINNKDTATCHADDSSRLQSSSTFSFAATFPKVVSTCLETATEIYPTVLIGLILSTAALHYLPSLTSLVSSTTRESAAWSKDLWMRGLLLGSAVPLQLCEHTSVALAAAIQKAGGSPGLAFAFLLSAPATNLPSILWMYNSRGFQKKEILPLILIALCGTALALSYVVDASHLDLLAGEATGEMAQLPAWWSDASPYLSGGMLAAGWYQKYLASSAASRSKALSKDHCDACGEAAKTKAE